MEQLIYFISYTTRTVYDVAWAKWVSWVIENKLNGKTIIQEYDFRPGDSFKERMHDALIQADFVVCVLTCAYLKSSNCTDEWVNADKIIPIKFDDCTPPGLLKTRIYIDLYGLDKNSARNNLISKMQGIKRPVDEPDAPFVSASSQNDEPEFPNLSIIPSPVPSGNDLPSRSSTVCLPPVHNLPEYNIYFTGREDILTEMHNRFHNDGKSICLKQTIAGLSGVGKSQIVNAYAHRYGYEYKDAIWWINSETEDTIFFNCQELIKKLSLITGNEPIDASKLCNILKNWQNDTQSWLLIFDNVEREEVVVPYISPQYRGHILFTSGKHDLRKLNSRNINIDVYSFEDSLLFMRERLKDSASLISKDIELVVLIERLGRFPLVLEQAAAYMERTGSYCNDYLCLLQNKGLSLLDDDYSVPATEYGHTVKAAFELSYNILCEESKQLLNLCVYMAPDKIPLEFFIRNAESFPQPLCDTLKNNINKAVADLRNYSMVHRDGDFLNMHRFLQEIGREYLISSEVDWKGYCLEAMINTLPNASEYDKREKYDWFEIIAVHASAVSNYVEGVPDKQPRTALLYNLIGIGYDNSGQYSLALEWYQNALAISEKVLGKEHPDTATTYNNIAIVYKNQGDYPKALEWYQKALTIREKVLGEEHPDTAIIYNNIAIVYKNQGDYPKALEWYQKSLVIKEKVFGNEHPSTATTYNNIALVYSRQGDYPKALEWHKKALAIHEKILGEEHPSTAATYNNIAGVYVDQGDYPKALEWYQKALNIYEKVLGKEHPDTAIIYNNIAEVYESQVDYPKARDLFLRAVIARDICLLTNHPHRESSFKNLQDCYKKAGGKEENFDEWFAEHREDYPAWRD